MGYVPAEDPSLAEIIDGVINLTVLFVISEAIKVAFVIVGTELLLTVPYLNSINPVDSYRYT